MTRKGKVKNSFEPNTMLLTKMGWKINEYNNFSKYGSDVKFYIKMGDYDYTFSHNNDVWSIFQVNNNNNVKLIKIIDTNIDLMKTLIDIEAYSLDYKRDIRINKLLR
jgi:hypothetical protein